MALTAGQMLGAYQIEDQIGQGGMATIYRAHHARLDRRVAIKVLHPSFLSDSNFLARFEREAQIVARLEHPHIVPIYDFSEYEGQPYLVMKYIDGYTLKQRIEHEMLTLEQILRMMTPLADALDYAHANGVLHRDIKPSNIVIEAGRVGVPETPYLTDFGLARMAQLGDSTLSSDMLLGTPHYISPEQAQGKRDLDARTDIYSFGVVLYELLTGRVPYSADTPFAVIHDQIYAPLPLPSLVNPAITPAVEAVLVKVLAKEPNERYERTSILIEALRRAAQESGMMALDPNRVRAAAQSRKVLPVSGDEGGDTLQMADAPSVPGTPMPARRAAASDALPSSGFPFPVPLPGIGGAFPVPPPRAPQPLPSIPAPSYDFDDADARKPKNEDFWGQGDSRDAGESRGSAARRYVSEVEWGSVGSALAEAGGAVRDAVKDAFNNEDYIYAPEDDDRALRRRIEKQLEKRREFAIHFSIFVMVNTLICVLYFSGTFALLAQGDVDAMYFLSNDGFPFPMIVLLGWGAGLIGHAVDTYYQTGERARRRITAVHDQFRAAYGERWWTAPKSELRRIRRRAEQPFEDRKEFFSHLGVFVSINIMLWMIFSLGIISDLTNGTFDAAFPWPLFVTLGWGVGLVAHGAKTFASNRYQRHIDHEVERERAFLQGESMAYAKPKNDARRGGEAAVSLDDLDAQMPPPAQNTPSVRLTGDGELTNSFVEDMRDPARQRRS